jgi:hypothetical protein
MSESKKIPDIIVQLKLPEEVRVAVIREAFALGLDPKDVLAAFRAIYSLGFYDGAMEGQATGVLVKLGGINYGNR